MSLRKVCESLRKPVRKLNIYESFAHKLIKTLINEESNDTPSFTRGESSIFVRHAEHEASKGSEPHKQFLHQMEHSPEKVHLKNFRHIVDHHRNFLNSKDGQEFHAKHHGELVQKYGPGKLKGQNATSEGLNSLLKQHSAGEEHGHSHRIDKDGNKETVAIIPADKAKTRAAAPSITPAK